MKNFSELNTTWFALIGLLWTGYLFLEGFDFGVSLVMPFIGRDSIDRRICLNAIGPVWDGNEVWVIVAGGATFAAFPLWYARLFSGFYLALFLVLMALIARGVSFELRGKVERPRWQAFWDGANFTGSLVAALVWGAAFTNLAHGLPLSPGGRYYGGLIGLLHPVALAGGLAAACLFAFHGSLFLALKTGGALAERAGRSALASGAAAVVLMAVTLSWIAATGRPYVPGSLPGVVPLVFGIAAVASACVALVLAALHRAGYAFGATGLSIIAAMGGVFSRMFPSVFPASNVAANGITIGTAASLHNTLIVMTVVAAVFMPVVLAYQGWTYWVFRKRLTRPQAAREGPVRRGDGVEGSPAGAAPAN